MTTKQKSTKPELPTTLAIEEIQIPDLRVTSQIDPQIVHELTASIATDGILQPLQVARVGETYVLEDGLNRIMAAKELGLERVPVIVHLASEAEVLVRNLVLNRQRGKSNPAQEAEIIRHLIEVEGKTGEEVSALTGLSEGWVSRLRDVSALPPEVLTLISEGLLHVTSAWHITKLEHEDQKIQLARDAANWKYTEAQVKTRVAELLGTRPEIKPGEVKFVENGKPIITPLTCYFCHREVEKSDNYIWTCPDCRALVDAFWAQYTLGEQPALEAIGATAPKKLVLTDSGWAPEG